jgi:4-hydroxy-tetrahydrodipicolinate reductase
MRLAVVGVAGRMGRMLVRAVADDPECRLVGAVERPGSDAIGQDAGLVAGTGPPA